MAVSTVWGMNASTRQRSGRPTIFATGLQHRWGHRDRTGRIPETESETPLIKIAATLAATFAAATFAITAPAAAAASTGSGPEATSASSAGTRAGTHSTSAARTRAGATAVAATPPAMAVTSKIASLNNQLAGLGIQLP